MENNTSEDKEYKQWLYEDWFTSGETSWEEYFNDEARHNDNTILDT